MARILRNECHLLWRKNGGRRKDFDWSGLEAEGAPGAPILYPPPDRMSEQRQLCLFARDYVSELSDGLREVAQLSLFSELSDCEIAELLGIPMGTVKSRKNRAKSILKSKMVSIIEGNEHENNRKSA
jgi:DNA-directed RNA polymerase specialized sigma24 family protein